MLFWNILGNISILLKTINIYFAPSSDILQLSKQTCNFCAIYYSMDSLSEIVIYNRYAYIPHHLITIFLMYCIKTSSYHLETIQEYSLLFFFIEYTSLLLNVRSLIRYYGKLNLNLELFFYTNYVIFRLFLIPIIIWRLDNIYMIICTILIYAMSVYWLYNWTSKIRIKYNLKLLK